ncbi:MAG: hypothetical protein KFF46_08565 [Desulfobacterales bacterium]|nr:hypothetical protein [Desulfobacterales bacterium]
MSMYEAKRQGRNQVVYAHQIRDREIKRCLVLEIHLWRPISRPWPKASRISTNWKSARA